MFWSTRALIRELDAHFAELQSQSALLHYIDRLILRPEEAIDIKLKSVVQRFAELLRARGWAVIFPDGATLRAIYSQDRYLSERKDRLLSQLQVEVIRLNSDYLAGINANGTAKLSPPVVDVELNDDDDGSASILLIPVEGVTAEPFCQLAIIVSGLPRALTGLETEEVRDFASQVATQLSILIQRTQDAAISRFQLALNAVYFQSESGLREALSAAMDRASMLLPMWEPFDIDPPAIVQLLSFRGFDKSMQMLAAGGGGPTHKNGDAVWKSLIGKPVPIDDSICGHYFKTVFPKQKIKGAWTTNPKREHPELFKSFQGTDIPESEMVVPLLRDETPIGVLNFEHREPNVFSRYHTNMAEKIAQSFVPFLTQVHQLEARIREREDALLQTVSRQITRIKGVVGHKADGHLRAVSGDVDALKRRFKSQQEIHQMLDDLYLHSEELKNYMVSFIAEIPDYLHSGKTDLVLSIRRAINLLGPKNEQIGASGDSYLVERYQASANIEVTWPKRKQEVFVFASPLLPDHVFSLLDNALYAIAERRKRAEQFDAGLITIGAELHDITDDRGKRIPGHRVAITVTDNGAGVPPDLVRKIFAYGVGTKQTQGTGRGLPAARDYVRGHGGEIDGDNRADECGYRVVMFLDEFDPLRHGATAIVDT